MNNILIATDIAEENKNVLSRAIQLAHTSNAKLHVLHVFQTVRIPGMGDDKQSGYDQCKAYVQQVLADSQHGNDIDFVIHVADGGRVYDRVDEYAQKIHADLIVIGKSDRSKNTPDFVSTTTERIAAETHWPVLIVSRDVTEAYQSVLVRMDKPSLRETGLPLVSTFGPDIHITLLGHKREQPYRGGVIARLRQKSYDRRMEGFIKEAKTLLAESNLPEDRLVCKNAESMDAETLIGEARQCNADVLVFKARPSRTLKHKPDAFTRKLLEKTSYDVLTHGRG